MPPIWKVAVTFAPVVGDDEPEPDAFGSSMSGSVVDIVGSDAMRMVVLAMNETVVAY